MLLCPCRKANLNRRFRKNKSYDEKDEQTYSMIKEKKTIIIKNFSGI